jgi:hypothetical protein
MTSHFLWASRTTPLRKQGQELRSEQTVPPLHEQSPATYFLRLNNLETFVELVGAKSLHLLTQTVPSLKSPTGAFIASQTLIFRRKQIIRTHPLSEISSDYFCLVHLAHQQANYSLYAASGYFSLVEHQFSARLWRTA